MLQSVEALKKATPPRPALLRLLILPEVETALAGLQKVQHTIIIRRRNAGAAQPDIALDLIDDTRH